MISHTVALLLRVTAQEYGFAARQRHDGQPSASPLALALFEKSGYALIGAETAEITLRELATGRRYMASVPAILAYYLADFWRGVWVFEDHEFELVLVSKDD